MARKVKIEIDADAEEEVIIRCSHLTNDILELQKLIENSSSSDSNIIELSLADRDYYVNIDDILFFETEDGHTSAHTKTKMYTSHMKLYELTESLPKTFMRVSKSCILNMRAVSSLKKGVTGVCEAYLKGCDKKVYISRMYYKPFKEALKERLGK